MITSYSIILYASLGAALQEVLWWYNVRRRIDEEETALLKSRAYWVITIIFIVISGAIAPAWFEGRQAPLKDALVFGAFLPAILKQVGRAVVNERPLGSIGAGRRPTATVADYFKV